MWKPLALVVACCAMVGSQIALADEGSQSTPVPAVPAAQTCDHHCQFMRDRRKLRKATDRNPIPIEIVMCESGGNYRALNPSSHAGGKYQALPSTWSAYLPGRRIIRLAEELETRRDVKQRVRHEGQLDKGPQMSSPLLQDIVAAAIWNGQGRGAWSC